MSPDIDYRPAEADRAQRKAARFVLYRRALHAAARLYLLVTGIWYLYAGPASGPKNLGEMIVYLIAAYYFLLIALGRVR